MKRDTAAALAAMQVLSACDRTDRDAYLLAISNLTAEFDGDLTAALTALVAALAMTGLGCIRMLASTRSSVEPQRIIDELRDSAIERAVREETFPW